MIFVQDLKEAGIIFVKWTPEDENESDIFTKNAGVKSLKSIQIQFVRMIQ